MALSNVTIKGAGSKDKSYKLFDGGGLYVEIMPTGKKLWRLKYYYLKKEKRISFGAYPLVSLADAREARDDAKRLLIKGIDPSQAKKDKKIVATRNAENTFQAVALEWLDVRGHDWTKGYKDKLVQALEGNIFPFIGDKPIADITPPELLEVLRKIEGRGSFDIAQRTKSTCSRIFQYGISVGKCEWDAAQNLKGALKSHKTEHFRALDLKQLPDFLKALERNEARIYERTRRAVWLSLLTFCRPQEIRMARWDHIDFDKALWTIPAELMKMRKDHIVPLSSQVIDVLQAQREELDGTKTEWVFPSQVRLRNPMSDGTVNKAIKRLGFGNEMVAHGFRALARTTIAEQLHYPAEVIEKQLAHKTNNPLGEAYDRTQFLDQRKKMMQAWADYVDQLLNQGNVIQERVD